MAVDASGRAAEVGSSLKSPHYRRGDYYEIHNYQFLKKAMVKSGHIHLGAPIWRRSSQILWWKGMHSVMGNNNLTPEGDSFPFVFPQRLPYLSDYNLAHDLIDALRWDDVPVCPRCSSRYTKRVNTHVFRQLYRCIDCGYMFNSLAGTIFHGSKMPVNKYIHFFILHNAFDSVIPLRDLGYALDVSHKTASLLTAKVSHIVYPFRFAVVDKALSRSLPEQQEGDAEEAPFFAYCQIKSVFVSDELLRRFLQQLTKGAVKGVEHVHIDR